MLAGWNRTLQSADQLRDARGSAHAWAAGPVVRHGHVPAAWDSCLAGDPDFDLLRITAGTDFGMPSPGHTTLRKQPGGDWAVDSFFDITYRIDFVGHPGGHVGGMSGSTTGTIRMQTGNGVGCVHPPTNCDDGNPCTVDSCDPVSGCVHLLTTCDDGQICTVDACDPATGQCTHTPANCDDGNACTTDSCVQALVDPAVHRAGQRRGHGDAAPGGLRLPEPGRRARDHRTACRRARRSSSARIHKDFICNGQRARSRSARALPPGSECEQPGGSARRQRRSAPDSSLALTLHGTGTLAG